ncbi:MAG: phosphatase PAP2 family protein [Desulfobacteraceae bacterium]|nr:MAG: phosphatase PAP2 family protein [Desulfobacteraceae bacterium]
MCVAVAAGCCSPAEKQTKPAAVPEIRPGVLAGYLQPEALPDSLALLPPPPSEGSAALACDEEISRNGLALRDTPRWTMAGEDAELMFPEAAGTFSCALGIPITEQDTPHLYMILRRTLTDAGLSTSKAKKHYQRKRPFQINQQPICTPDEEPFLIKNGSYPSGHTAAGWAWALILTEIAPDRADELLARGRAYGESRIVCNVHWNSDVAEGRFMGAATVARLHADPAFRADLEAAKEEYAAARDKGLRPSQDCESEARTLAIGLRPLSVEAEILKSWQGDFPLNQLHLLPEGQRQSPAGFIDSAQTFTDVWKALKPGEGVPVIDFNANLVLFARNTQFFNRISIGKVDVKNGVAQLLAMETMSANPLEDKAAMSMVVVSKSGVSAIQTGDKIIPIAKSH